MYTIKHQGIAYRHHIFDKTPRHLLFLFFMEKAIVVHHGKNMPGVFTMMDILTEKGN